MRSAYVGIIRKKPDTDTHTAPKATFLGSESIKTDIFDDFGAKNVLRKQYFKHIF